MHVPFYEDSSCEASPSFPPSDKLEHCLETTAKKYRTEQDSHRDPGSYSSRATALWRSYLEKEGGLFRPQFCIHKVACRQEKLVSNPSRPSPGGRLTPCPYSCAASPVFLAVGRQIIQVQTAPKTWLLTINFLIQILFHLPDV